MNNSKFKFFFDLLKLNRVLLHPYLKAFLKSSKASCLTLFLSWKCFFILKILIRSNAKMTLMRVPLFKSTRMRTLSLGCDRFIIIDRKYLKILNTCHWNKPHKLKKLNYINQLWFSFSQYFQKCKLSKLLLSLLLNKIISLKEKCSNK